jgi:hypothetical protein
MEIVTLELPPVCLKISTLAPRVPHASVLRVRDLYLTVAIAPVNRVEDKQKRNQTLRPLENREGSATRKFNAKGCATRQ